MIIFFYGENDFKISQKIKELQNKFVQEVNKDGQSIFKFEGEKLKKEDFISQINNDSLFSEKKMVIIFDLIKNKQKGIFKKLLEYLKKDKINNSADIFIFIERNIKSKGTAGLLKAGSIKDLPLNLEEKELYTFLKIQKYSQEFKNYTGSELSNFIKNELNRYNLKIDNKEIQLLIAITGNNPWNVYNEIKKIAHYKFSEEDKKVNQKDIEKISSEIFSENIFNFTDAISAKNTKQALKLLEEQYSAGSEPDYILTMLLRQFKILLQIRELLDQNYNSQKIISALKLKPFIVNKGINQAKNFESQTIKKIINKLSEIEINNRSGLTNIKANLGLIIAKL
ncbi:MAG: DNA polymerase III subunit delta [Patescibacteria group bacterium]|jgi:DNA polymerase-3 subunit delta